MVRHAVDTSCFGGFLKSLRLERDIGFDEFRLALGVSKAYLNDVETGKSRPPTPGVQFKMIKLLNKAKELSAIETNRFYTLAAQGRGELPADVTEFLRSDGGIDEIRRSHSYIEFWQKYGI